MGHYHLASVFDTSFSLPSFEIFINLIPPGLNPYVASMDFVEKVVFPVVPDFTYVLLIVFGTANLLTVFACLAVILVPLLRSREFRKKHVWLWRAHYVDSISCPLYVPNAGLAVAITQALANFLFFIYSALSYFSFKDRQFSRHAYIFVWYDVCWLPGYIGFYLTAISAFYAWLCSPTRKITRNVFFRPAFLNTIFIAIPTLVTISCLAFAILIENRMQNFLEAYDSFRLHFTAAASFLDQQRINSTSAGIASKIPNFRSTVQAYENMSLTTIALLKILKYSSMNWIFAGLFLGLFYLAAVIVLIIMILSSSKAAKGGKTWFDENKNETESEKPTSSYRRRLAGLGWRRNSTASKHDVDPSEPPLQQILIPLSQDQLELRKGYSYLLKHCTLMIIGLLFDIGIGWHLMLSVEKLGNPIDRSVNSLLCCVDVIVISPAMLFQTWRIFNERDVTQFSVSEGTSVRMQGGRESRPQELTSLERDIDVEEAVKGPWENCVHRRSISTTLVSAP